MSFLGEELQKVCHHMLPAQSSEAFSLDALVCGSKIQSRQHKNALLSTGLIHGFVVSGSHLLVLTEFLLRLGWNLKLRILTLTLFTFWTGFQPPCCRSLMQILFSHYRPRENHRSDHSVFLCGLMLLILFPQWITSLSLQLSWAAALALSVAGQLWEDRPPPFRLFFSSSLIYVFIFPLLAVVNPSHPVTILWNILLGSVLNLFLFPLSALAYLHPWPLWIFEQIMPYFWHLLFELQQQAPLPFQANSVPAWLWIIFLHSGAHWLLTYMRRKTST